MSFAHDKFDYTPELVEAVLLSGPSHHLDHMDLVVDCDRALRWLKLEFPSGYRLVSALIAGWTLDEMAVKADATPEAVDAALYDAFVQMATWLNQ